MSLQTLTLTSLTILHIEANTTGRCYLSQGKGGREEVLDSQVILLHVYSYRSGVWGYSHHHVQELKT